MLNFIILTLFIIFLNLIAIKYYQIIYHKYLFLLITLDELRNCGIVDKYSGPRPFTFITQEQFETIYKLGMEE